MHRVKIGTRTVLPYYRYGSTYGCGSITAVRYGFDFLTFCNEYGPCWGRTAPYCGPYRTVLAVIRYGSTVRVGQYGTVVRYVRVLPIFNIRLRTQTAQYYSAQFTPHATCTTQQSRIHIPTTDKWNEENRAENCRVYRHKQKGEEP